MENQIKIFTNEEFGNVRTVMMEGEPWFVGRDVAECLGYKDQKDALRKHVDTEDKQLIQKGRIASFEIPTRGMTFINESGLYSLVLSSKLPTAKKFKRWITSEVIPTIRKHGAYMTEATIEKALTSPDFLIQLATKLKEEQEARKLAEQKSKELSKQVKESNKANMILKCENTKLKPKADYADDVLQSTETMTITQIAKDYGVSAITLNTILHSLGIQYKVNGQWVLYSEYAGRGYTESHTQTITHKDGTPGAKVHTRWTQKGRMFIHEQLKKGGMLSCEEM